MGFGCTSSPSPSGSGSGPGSAATVTTSAVRHTHPLGCPFSVSPTYSRPSGPTAADAKCTRNAISGARPTASHVAPASSVRYTVPRPSTTSALGPPNGSTPFTPPPTPSGGPSSRRTPAESGPHVSPPSSLTHTREPTCPLIRPAITVAYPPPGRSTTPTRSPT